MEYSFAQIEQQIASERLGPDECCEEDLPGDFPIAEGEAKEEEDKNWELKELQPKHELVLLMYLEGVERDKISQVSQLSKWWISRIIHSKVGKAYMQAKLSELDDDFKALYRKAISAIRDGLDDQNIDIRLKAAEKYLKCHGHYDRKDPGKDTAEDVVKRILEFKVTETVPVAKQLNESV